MNDDKNLDRYNYYSTFYDRFCHVDNDKLMLDNDLTAQRITDFIDKLIEKLDNKLNK